MSFYVEVKWLFLAKIVNYKLKDWLGSVQSSPWMVNEKKYASHSLLPLPSSLLGVILLLRILTFSP